MSECRKHIKCKKIFGKVIGVDLDGNYITVVNNTTYILYDKDIDIKENRKVILYELPDGILLSKLTPSLGIEAANSISKEEYEKTLDDSTSEQIIKKSILIGSYAGVAIAILELITMLILYIVDKTYISYGFALFLFLPISVFLVWLVVSTCYDFIMHKKYARLDPQEYFEKTGELMQEEIYQMCEYRLKRISYSKHMNKSIY